MARDRDKESSEVRQLIMNTLEDEKLREQRAESPESEPESDEDQHNSTFGVDRTYDNGADSPENTRLMQVKI